jgi:hypothetical protein
VLDTETNQDLSGTTFDNRHPENRADFRGSKMPLTATRPGTMSQSPSQVRRTPQINIRVDQNQAENGYNVTVGGSGWVPGEIVTIEGCAVQGSKRWEWVEYTKGVAPIRRSEY